MRIPVNSSNTRKSNRRTFLQASAAALVASRLPLAAQIDAALHDADVIPVPDSGWRLWPDQKAEWKNDTVYLPEDVHIASLTANPPTGGWEALSATQGIPVTLP